MTLNLGERDKRILEAVIQDYIRTAEPVSSRVLSKMYNLDLSPATIRNVMADLEDLGLLRQPHTSAGRIPTQRGLRYYVDTILEVGDISSPEQEVIYQKLAGSGSEAEQIIKRTSKVLSSVSKHMGVVLAPRFSSMVLRQIQFVRLDGRMVLAILVGSSGMIQNRIVEVEQELSQEDLDRFNRYLNDVLEGLTITEIKAKIVEEMRQEKIQFDQMLSRALVLSRKVFDDQTIEDDIYIDGQVNLLEYPEFADVAAMKAIFSAFEDKSILIKLLDGTMDASGVQIFIGSETDLAEMQGCTLIASRYSRGSRPLGTLGVIGPTRLNYSKIIPVVDYTAKLISHILASTV
ncbi:MAG: heat-inducible transcriptional repressor HrcA [Pseudomonadota bacterium]